MSPSEPTTSTEANTSALWFIKMSRWTTGCWTLTNKTKKVSTATPIYIQANTLPFLFSFG